MKKIIFSIILSTLCAFHINAQQISVNAVAPFPGNIVDIGPAGHGFTITIHNNTGADLSEKYRFNFSQTGLYYNNIVSNSAKVVVESVAADHSNFIIRVDHQDPGEITTLNFTLIAGSCFELGGLNQVQINNVFGAKRFDSNTNDFTITQSLQNNPSLTIRKVAFLVTGFDNNRVFYKGTVKINSDMSVPGNLNEYITRDYILQNTSSSVFDGYVSFMSNDPATTALQVEEIAMYDFDPAGSYPTDLTATPGTQIFAPTVTTQLGGTVSIPVGHWLVIREKIKVTGCLDNNNGQGQKTIRWIATAFEPCSNSGNSAGRAPNVTQGTDRANLVVHPESAYKSTGTCTNSSLPSSKEIVYHNNGTAVANDVYFQITNPALNNTVVPLNSVRVKIERNGVITDYTPDLTYNNLKNQANPASTTIDWSTLPTSLTSNPAFQTYSAAYPWVISSGSVTTPKSILRVSMEMFATGCPVIYNCYAPFNQFFDEMWGVGSAPLSSSCLPSGANTINMYNLVITKLIDGSNNQVSINLNPGDKLRVTWDEYYCCHKETAGSVGEIVSCIFATKFKTECGVETPLAGIGRYYHFTAGSTQLTPLAGNTNLAADEDRCILTTDGQIEHVNNKMLFHGGLGEEINNRNGKIVFKVYLEDGLDMDMSFDKPFTKQYGGVDERGFNNVHGENDCNSDCNPKNSSSFCNTNDVLTTPTYFAQFTPKTGAPIPLTIRLLAHKGDALSSDVRKFRTNQPFGYQNKEAYLLYSMELDLSDPALDDDLAGTHPEGMQYFIRQLLNEGLLSFDLRCYCPQSKSGMEDMRSYMKIQASYDKCTSQSNTLDYCGEVYSTSLLPITSIDYRYQVNCPGCRIPGSNVSGEKISRVNKGLLDTDKNGFPDDNTTLVPDGSPSLRLASNGDIMRTEFNVVMSDGESGSLGFTKAELDGLNRADRLLDNLFVRVNMPQGEFTYMPSTAQARLAGGTWVPAHFVELNNRTAVFQIKAQEVGAQILQGTNLVYSFHTGSSYTVDFRADFRLDDFGWETDLKDVNYRAGYSWCDNCTTFQEIAPNLAESNTSFAYVQTIDNALLWCTHGGLNFKFISYRSENLLQTYNFNYEEYQENKCKKMYAFRNWGEFGFTNNGYFNMYEEECRYFLPTDNRAVKYEAKIPDGYEVDEVKIQGWTGMSKYYIWDIHTIKSTDLPNYLESVRGAGKNSIYYTTVGGKDVVGVNIYYQHETEADRIVGPNNYQATGNGAFEYRRISTNSWPDRIYCKDEHWYTEVYVSFKAKTSCPPAESRTYITDHRATNAPNYTVNPARPYEPDHYESIISRNPNAWLNLTSALPYIPSRSGYGGPTEDDPNSNFDIYKLTYQSPTLQLTNTMDQIVTVSGNKLYIRLRVKNQSNSLLANYPFLLVEGSALDAAKGLTYKGIYFNGTHQYVNYPVYFDNSGSTPRILIAYNRPEYLDNNNSGLRHLPTMTASDNGYDLVLEFDYLCTNLTDQGCGLNPVITGLNHDQLSVKPGTNCYKYPNFSDLASVCGLFDPITYDLSGSPYGTEIKVNITNGATTIANPLNYEANSCSQFGYQLELRSCQEGSISGFDVRFTNIPAELTLRTDLTTTSNTSKYVLTQDGTDPTLYHITIPQTTDYLNSGETITATFPFDVSCSFVTGNIATEVKSRSDCGAVMNANQISPLLVTLATPPAASLDGISLTAANVTVAGNVLSVNYTLNGVGAANDAKFDNNIAITLTGGASPLSFSIPVPAGTVNNNYTATFILPLNCATYEAEIEVSKGYVGDCGYTGGTPLPFCQHFFTAETITKTIAVATSIPAFINTAGGGAPFLCTGSSAGGLRLEAYPKGSSYTYSWSGPSISGSTTLDYALAAGPGTYTVTVSDNVNGCTPATASIQVTDKITVDCPAGPICPGDRPSITIHNSTAPGSPVVVGGYDAQWYDNKGTPGDVSDDVLLENGIQVSGNYYVVAIAHPAPGMPSCTLTTEAFPCYMEVHPTPAPYQISILGTTYTSVLICPGDSKELTVNNPNVNDAYVNASSLQSVWSNNAPAPANITVDGVGHYYITTLDPITGCSVESNTIKLYGTEIRIYPECDPTNTGIVLRARANFGATSFVWKQDGTVIPATTETITVTDANKLYTVEADLGNCHAGDGFYMPSPLPINYATPQNLITDGTFAGIVPVCPPTAFGTDLGCLTAVPSDPIDLIGKVMLNDGANYNGAALWNPGKWTGTGRNGIAANGTDPAANNEFLIVDGAKVPGSQLLWKKEAVTLDHGYRYLFRAHMRNIDVATEYPVKEIPEVQLVINFKDGQGHSYGWRSYSQVLLNNNNQINPWVEIDIFELADVKTDALLSWNGITTNADIYVYMQGGNAIGRDLGLDDIELWPVGACDQLSVIDGITPCSGVRLDYDQIICPSGISDVTILQPVAGNVTYALIDVVNTTSTPVGMNFQVTPTTVPVHAYQLVAEGDNCKSTISFEVFTQPLPQLTIVPYGNNGACDQSYKAYINGSENTSLTYVWKKNNIVIAGAASSSITLNSIVNGDQLTCETAVTWCTNASDLSATIALNGVVTAASAGADQQQCGNDNFTVSANTPTSGTGVWTIENGTATITDPSNPASTITGVAVGTSVTLRWTISNGVCPPSYDEVVLENRQPPVVSTITGNTTLCANTTGNSYSVTDDPAYTYTWQYSGTGATINGSGSTITLDLSPSATSGDLSVKIATATCGAGDPSILSIVINPLPAAPVVGHTPLCTGTTGQISISYTEPNVTGILIASPFSTVFTAMNIPGGINFIGQVGNTDADIIAGVVNAQGCTTTVTLPGIVHPAISAVALIASPSAICEGQTSQLSGVITGGTAPYTYEWTEYQGSNPPATLFGTSPVVAPLTNAQYSLYVTDVNGCTAASAALASVSVNPKPVITATGSTTVCQGGFVELNTTLSGVSYQWKKDGNSIGGATSSSYQATVSGNYTLEVTYAAGCSLTSSAISVVVNPLPASQITTTSLASCNNQTVGINYNTGPGMVQFTLPAGIANAGVTSPSPGVQSQQLSFATVTSQTTYQVTANTILNGCTTTVNIPVTVKPMPASQILTSSLTNCNNATVGISYNTSPGTAGVIFPLPTGIINAGGLNPAPGISVQLIRFNTVTAPVTYQVPAYTTLNGCSTFVNVAVTVKPMPANQITTTPQTVCSNQQALLVRQAGPATSRFVQPFPSGVNFVSETFGTNTATTNISFNSLTAQTTYAITGQTILAGCTTTVTVPVTVRPAPTVANAGPDRNICSSTTTLAGNPPTVGTGSWSIVSGSGFIFNPSSPTTSVLVTSGSTTFRWTITGTSPCAPSTDDVVILRSTSAPTATVSPNQTICGASASITGNTPPAMATGVWTVVSGTATITNPNSPTTTVSGLIAGTTVTLRWRVTNACGSNSATLQITRRPAPTTANAGPDKTVCGTSTFLAGNTPSAGTGVWTVVSGSANIANTSNPTSNVSGLSVGNVVLRWTVSNSCGSSSDDVIITRSLTPTVSNAGPNKTVCGSSTSLAGNTPAVGTGTWTVISGSASISNPSSPTSTVTGLSMGNITLRWTISNACGSSSDDVVITRSATPTIANAGPDKMVCATSTSLSGNTPAVGTGVWTVVSGSANIANNSNPTSNVSGLSTGTIILRWTISNACGSSSDDVVITRAIPPTTANAGPDRTFLCGANTNLAGNTPSVGTGTWTLVSGNATINNPFSPTSSVRLNTRGQDNVFRWTITNPPCPPSSDDVTLRRFNFPGCREAGEDVDDEPVVEFTEITPNPSESNFNLMIRSLKDKAVEVVVMDLNGKVVQQEKARTNEIFQFGQDYSAGVYAVKIIDGEIINTYKVIKIK